MRKIAVFLEGQTELIIVKHLILLKHNWQVQVECLKLVADGETDDALYPYPFEKAEFEYLLIQVGNDKKVLSTLLSRGNSLVARGYERFVGLRDMYSEEYKNASSIIDAAVDLEFLSDIETEIKKSTNYPLIHFCFAIMEIEAWFLGMYPVLERLNSALTPAFISQTLKCDIEVTNPETHFFHPANDIMRILETVGINYDKSAKMILTIASKILEEDYEGLYNHTKCHSFNIFYDSLFPN